MAQLLTAIFLIELLTAIFLTVRYMPMTITSWKSMIAKKCMDIY
jgi:hypothetical protein